MSRLVANASALVSLGTVAGNEPDPLSTYVAEYDAVVPTAVIQELQETAFYGDAHGRAATAVLERTEALETRSVSRRPPPVRVAANHALSAGLAGRARVQHLSAGCP